MTSLATKTLDLDQAIRALGAKASQSQPATPRKYKMSDFVPKPRPRKQSLEQEIAEKTAKYTEEYVGKTFANLVVLGPVERSENKAWRVLCRCTVCGTETMWPITTLAKRKKCTCSSLLTHRAFRERQYLTRRRHPLEAIIAEWVLGKKEAA